MIIFSSSLTVPGQPSPRFNVEARLPFRNYEMDYVGVVTTGNADFPFVHARCHLQQSLPFVTYIQIPVERG